MVAPHLVPKLRLGMDFREALLRFANTSPRSRDSSGMCSQAGAWEQVAPTLLHPAKVLLIFKRTFLKTLGKLLDN